MTEDTPTPHEAQPPEDADLAEDLEIKNTEDAEAVRGGAGTASWHKQDSKGD